MEKQRGIVYGLNAVLEAARACEKTRIQKIIIADNRRYDKNIKKLIALANKKNIRIEKKNSHILNKICGTIKNQGVAGIVYKKNSLSLDELIATISYKPNKQYLTLAIVEGIEDPGNLGALIRSAEVLGVDGIIIPKRRAVGITPTVCKSSAGAVEHIPIATVVNIANTIDYLKNKGFWIVAAEPMAEKRCYECNFLIHVAVVLGGEARGMRNLIKNKCDLLISIPVEGMISSLNVSAASSIIFYEILRQRVKIDDRKLTSEL